MLLDLLAELWRACENVDRHLVMLVFVRRVAPFEAVRSEAIALTQECHSGGDRREIAARGHVNLAAAAGGLRVLLEGRLERRCAEMDAFQPDAVQARGEHLAVEPGRADQLEGTRCAASFRQHRALEQHRARIDDGRVERRHIGGGHHPGDVGRVEIHVPRPALHRHGLELGADLEMLVEQARELGDGHAVAHRHAKQADEGFITGLERRPLHVDPADRIGAIANDDGKPCARGGAEAIRHGVDEGVDARARRPGCR